MEMKRVVTVLNAKMDITVKTHLIAFLMHWLKTILLLYQLKQLIAPYSTFNIPPFQISLMNVRFATLKQMVHSILQMVVEPVVPKINSMIVVFALTERL